ncbi:MAG: peptidylprolyl isomerase [Desulfuromonadales bacterium]|nr:peptidylprolyl isomerase [Desulfuromonadales bacterium]
MSVQANPIVRLETSMGPIVLELDAEKAPLTVENFLGYVRSGHYEGTVFHRVIDGFMIQGGGMTADLRQKPTGPSVKNEAGNGLKNRAGTIAMARTQSVDSATSQFFINVDDNDFLDHSAPTPQGYGYAVFGRVIGGMETVDAIRQVRTGNRGGHQDVPLEPVVIDKVTIEEQPAGS